MDKWFDKSEKELLVAINMAMIEKRKIRRKKDKLFMLILMLILIINLVNMILLIK